MNPIRHILAATDFSADGMLALQRGAELARRLQSHLEWLHVINAPAFAAIRALFPAATDYSDQLVADARARLDAAVTALGLASEPVQTTVTSGAVTDEILAACSRTDLLLLGARGMNPVRDLLVGTTAMRILRRNTLPTLVVRNTPQDRYRHVLVPVDLTTRSKQVLDAALRLAPDAQITLLHVIELPFEGKMWLAGVADHVIDAYRQRALQAAMEHLQQLAAPHPGTRCRCIALPGDAAFTILEQARALGVDLVTVGKNTSHDVVEFLLGSTARHVLSDAHCDVLVLHPQDD
jgi:nucleotide-binding universal stress UspA family protein